MKVTTLNYERKFGGSRGAAIEEYGSEALGVELVADEGETISLEETESLFKEIAKRVLLASTKGQKAVQERKKLLKEQAKENKQ